MDKLRNAMPDLTLRTAVIVGFPGETDAQFEELVDFVRHVRFERLGAFAYSREEGTPAAALPHQVPERVKQERLHELMTVQQEISESLNRGLVGRTLRVLVDREGRDEGCALVGRTQGDAPEIDNEVLITDGDAQVGAFADVAVTQAHGYDLVGSVRPA